MQTEPLNTLLKFIPITFAFKVDLIFWGELIYHNENDSSNVLNAHLEEESEETTDKEFRTAVEQLGASIFTLGNSANINCLKAIDIFTYLKTLENYFITPGNLLFDCKSLQYVGTLFPDK